MRVALLQDSVIHNVAISVGPVVEEFHVPPVVQSLVDGVLGVDPVACGLHRSSVGVSSIVIVGNFLRKAGTTVALGNAGHLVVFNPV
jgi:hypothetical protein